MRDDQSGDMLALNQHNPVVFIYKKYFKSITYWVWFVASKICSSRFIRDFKIYNDQVIIVSLINTKLNIVEEIEIRLIVLDNYNMYTIFKCMMYNH